MDCLLCGQAIEGMPPKLDIPDEEVVETLERYRFVLTENAFKTAGGFDREDDPSETSAGVHEGCFNRVKRLFKHVPALARIVNGEAEEADYLATQDLLAEFGDVEQEEDDEGGETDDQ